MSIKLTRSDIERIAENISFPNEEENILKYWNEEKVFENCLKQSKGKPRYVLMMKSFVKVIK
jgi:isoleucyl-tRNA synthetase